MAAAGYDARHDQAPAGAEAVDDRPAAESDRFLPAEMELRMGDEDWWKHFKHYDDEHEWKAHPKAAAFAQEVVEVEPEQLREGVLVYRWKTDWLDDPDGFDPTTFSRESTRDLLRIILQPTHETKVLLIGNPGTGKSRFLWELLRAGLHAGRVVVLEMRKEAAVFVFVPPRPGQDGGRYRVFWIAFVDFTAVYCAALRDRDTLWLIDPRYVKNGADPNPAGLPAFTVLAAPPNKAHYKGWDKHPAQRTLYFAPWRLPELKAVLPVEREVCRARLDRLYGAGLSSEDLLDDVEIEERFGKYGGIISMVFGDEENRKAYDQKLKYVYARLSDRDLLPVIGSSMAEVVVFNVEQERRDRVSSLLFAYEPCLPGYDKKTVVPLLAHLEQRLRHAYLGHVRSLKNPEASEYRNVFEYEVGLRVSGEFEMVPLGWPNVKEHVFGRQTPRFLMAGFVMSASRFRAPAVLADGKWAAVVGRLVETFKKAQPPAGLAEGWTRPGPVFKSKQPVFDFFEVAWHRAGGVVAKVPVAYQATVSEKHPMSSEHLLGLLDQLGCSAEAPLVVVFVVPRVAYSRLLGFRREKKMFEQFRAQTTTVPVLAPADLDRVAQFKCRHG